MPATGDDRLFMAGTVADALAALAERGSEGAPFAGGTWIMRAPIRREAQAPFYVGVGRIPELNAIDVAADRIHIGASVTHARLAAQLAGVAPCHGLATAAGSAANPAIREMATVGGNLSTSDFSAADLPPALLCLDAEVELATTGGRENLPLERFLATRRDLDPGTLVTGVTILRRPVLTGHARLPLRKAGDYPVAIVSLAVQLNQNGVVEDGRVAVGSVESSARRWPGLERKLVGHPLDPRQAEALAEAELGAFTGRDGVEAPGWYRVQVLPALVRRAAQAALRSRS
ncbi:FAD binding domain-containing protein [Mesorhizobium sp. BAC0120]|uniref:FAD binding domain-containing protein n=1 Tax=Mesorhizobium sp. BAC0120 TaxID=3090670 RepID=UPI00298CFFF9|nr:FAD binding domain-containing protein [Mesorhizobium sp. BAC0120]MDW6020162.1 FAD binding domain-containing protein [Mesorhizobium sp. BAC0120]